MMNYVFLKESVNCDNLLLRMHSAVYLHETCDAYTTYSE